MKLISLLSRCLLMFAVLALFNANKLSAQEMAQPTDGHKILKLDVGTWEAKGKMWMPGSEEPMEFEAVEVNRMIGEFWIVSDFKGNFGGMDFVGRSKLGYDDGEKQYFGTWVDSSSPNLSKMHGKYDAKSKTLTMQSVGKGPDGSEMKGKNVVVYKDENTRVMTMFNANPEKEGEMMKVMEIIYTRKKDVEKGSR